MRQIGIEFHFADFKEEGDIMQPPMYSKQYFTMVQELYKLGFVTIMWDENRVVSTHVKGSPLFEIVFRRSNLGLCLV